MWSEIGSPTAPHHFIMRGPMTPEGKRIINSETEPYDDSYMVIRLITRKYVGGGWQWYNLNVK